MDADFWHRRWRKREIGFHKDEVHPFLPRFFPRLPQGSRVLVPLCGKSLDLLWLREQGWQVTGVELSQVAVEEFFAEHLLVPEIDDWQGFRRYRVAGLCLLCGDFFSLSPEVLGPLAAIYDRAALVALPLQMRPAYAEQLRRFLRPETVMLLISYDYPQEQMSGPPFSVPVTEIRQLFGPDCAITPVHSESTLGMHAKMQAAGLRSLREEVFLVSL